MFWRVVVLGLIGLLAILLAILELHSDWWDDRKK